MGRVAFLFFITVSLPAQVLRDESLLPERGRAFGPAAAAGVGPRRLAWPPAAARRHYAEPNALAALARLRGQAAPELVAEFAPGDRLPRAVYGFREELSGRPAPAGPPAEPGAAGLESVRRARAFLERWPELSGVSGEELEATAVHAGRALTAVRFAQRFRGFPVLGGGLVVQLDRSGAATGLLSGLVRGLRPPLSARVGGLQAIEAARRKLGGGSPVKEPLLAVARASGRDLLVWDLYLRARGRPWRLLVDAGSGEVLGAGDLLRSGGCAAVPAPRGLAFSPNPEKGPAALRDLPQLDCRSTSLFGDFVRSFQWIGEEPFSGDPLFELETDGRRAAGPDGGVLFDSRDLPAMARVNVYLHATLFHDFMRRLGFQGLERPLPAVVNAGSCAGISPCQAFYDPLFPYATGFGLLVFGASPALNLGLDGDLVYHEYAHAVVEATAGLGNDFLDSDLFFSLALNEGFADYFACTLAGDPDLAEYAGLAAGRPSLRRVENDRAWPESIDMFDPHQTGLIWSGACWSIRQALSGGGADPAGIEKADRLIYGCLTSLWANANLLRAATVLLASAGGADLSAAETAAVKEVLGRRGLVEVGGTAPLVFEELEAGGETSGQIAAAAEGQPRLAPVQYLLRVGPGGLRLTLELSGIAGTGNLDLYLRYNTPVTVAGGAVAATHRSEGPGALETLSIDLQSLPPLAPGIYFAAVASRDGSLSSYRLKAALETGTADPTRPLVPGVPLTAILPAGSLGPLQYRLEVADPAGRRLEVSAVSDRDIELLLRRGEPVGPGADGELAADLVVREPARAPATALGELTVPALAEGTYYLALRNVSAEPASVTILSDLPAAAPAPPVEVPLDFAAGREGAVAGPPAGVGLLDSTQFSLWVPEDGARLSLALTSAGDLGLYLRRGGRVDPSGGWLRFDHSFRAAAGAGAALEVDLFSAPPLQAGAYHAAVVNYGREPASYRLKADLSSALPTGNVAPLSSGDWTAVTLSGSEGEPAGKLADLQYRLTVSDLAEGLDIVTEPDGPGDLDLFLRRGRPVQMVEGNVVADWRGTTARGAEAITVLRRDLTPGDYYLALLNHETSPLSLRFLAVADQDPISLKAGDGDLIQGQLAAAPVPPTDCALELREIVVESPAQATRLSLSVATPGGGPLVVLERRGARVLKDQGELIFDHQALSSDGPLVIDGAELFPGLHFFALMNCQPGLQSFEATVRVEEPAEAEIALQDGVAASGLAAPAAPGSGRLHPTQYTIEAPPGTLELTLGLWGGQCAAEDLDLLVAYGERVSLKADGTTNARWRGARSGAGGELLVVNKESIPPLAPGKYFAAIVNRAPSAVSFQVGARSWPALSVNLPSGGSQRGVVPTAGQPGLGFLDLIQYRVEVFPGAEELVLDLDGDGDVDLLARFGLPVGIDGEGNVIADYIAATQSPAGIERLHISPRSDPRGCLRPGVYFVGVGNFELREVNFSLRAEVKGTPAIIARLGDVISGSQPPPLNGPLRPPDLQVALEVPPGTLGFQADLVGEPPDLTGNLDLFVRQGEPVDFSGAITATYSSQSDGPFESVTVPASKVVAGRYYLAVASRGPVEVRYRLRLLPLAETYRELGPGESQIGLAPRSSAAGLGWLGPEQFRLTVPAGSARIWVELSSDDPGSTLELSLRGGRRVEVEGRAVAADRSSGGAGGVKRISLGSPAPGDYYLAVRNLRPREEPFLIRAGTGPWILRGDADEDGQINITDPIGLLQRLFLGGRAVCPAAADADGSGVLDLTDAIRVLGFLFLGGPPPAPSYPECAPAGPGLEAGCSGAACPSTT